MKGSIITLFVTHFNRKSSICSLALVNTKPHILSESLIIHIREFASNKVQFSSQRTDRLGNISQYKVKNCQFSSSHENGEKIVILVLIKLRSSLLFFEESGTLQCGHILLTQNAVDFKKWATSSYLLKNTFSKQGNKGGY